MTRKFWIAAVAAYVVLNVIAFAAYAGLLASYLEEAMSGIGRAEALMWPYFVRFAIIALVMAFIYPKGYEGGTPWLEGLRFGLLIAVLLAVANVFDWYASVPVSGSAMFVLMIPEFIGLSVAGIVIGAVYGKIAE